METKIKYCECGCGRIVNKRFVLGHQNLGNNNPAKRPEVGKKISVARMGHPVSEETRQKISETFKRNGGHPAKGTTLPEDQKIKISIANKGKKRSDSFKKRMSESAKITKNFTGHKHTEESKLKMSLKKIGKKRSKEVRMNLSELHRGEKCIFWRGGISFEPYTPAFNKTLKKRIRERDNDTCQFPGCRKQAKSFPVHHIDYIKGNCDETNLITLCWSHHGKTNAGSRDFWQLFYEEIMAMKMENLKYRIKPIMKIA